MTFQVAVSAMLLAEGLNSGGLDVVSVMPERLEDIDCQLSDGSVLLVQVKEHGVNARAVAAAAVADILAHAANAAHLTISAQSQVRIAIVTNGAFGSGLPITGWAVTLAEALAEQPDGDAVLADVRAALASRLNDAELGHIDATWVLSRTHLVTTGGELGAVTRDLIGSGLEVPPAIAELVRVSLLADLGDLAAAQRDSTIDTVGRRTLTDLRVLANQVSAAVDLIALDEAVLAGVCEPVDFKTATPDSRTDFYAGVAVKPGHIVAGLDVVRYTETTAIMEGLESRRQVVIAGPSGSGKSCLLWRAARLLEYGPQLVRVRSVADQQEAAMLVRHVRRLMPDVRRRVVICVDDLGTPALAAWPGCRDELLQIPGVSVVGAVRHENAAPELTGNAVIVDPVLAEASAADIYEALSDAGTTIALAKEEALAGAGGLLMEFIALTTTGKRIRAVLGEQVMALSQPANRLAQRVLRLICAAHTLGFALHAARLATALCSEEEDVHNALRQLQSEHLLLSDDGITWRGVHDLRAEVLLELMHMPPPPLLADTYARAIRLLPPAAQGQAVRRAANRVATQIRQARAQLSPSSLLTEMETALEPFARYIGEALAAIPDDAPDRAVRAAGLLESADRLDVLAFVHAVLPLVQRSAPAGVDAHNLLWLSSMAREGIIDLDMPNFESVRQLGAQLPDVPQVATRQVFAALTSQALTQLIRSAGRDTAIRLAEAAEGLVGLTPDQAREAFLVHHRPDSGLPGACLDIGAATTDARLIATLTELSRVAGPEVAATFGPVERRAADAVAADPYGASLSVEYVHASQLPASDSALTRNNTFDAELACVVRAVQFLRESVTVDHDSVRTTSGSVSSSEQLVALARRLFDACPEADLLDVQIWQANRRPPTIDGFKILRAGSLPRPPTTRRNVTLQAVAAEALGAENWTQRCRAQAIVARELLTLINEVPSRISGNDNAGRRKDWLTRVQAVVAAVAALPLRPPERLQVLSAAAAAALTITGAEIDEAARSATGADSSRKSLSELAQCLQQLGAALGGTGSTRTVGFRFFGALSGIERALADGTPALSGIGETYPQELKSAVRNVAHLLTADQTSQVAAALRRGTKDLAKLQTAIDADTSANSAATKEALTRYLTEHGVEVAAFATVPDDDPAIRWLTQKVVACVDASQWDSAHAALYAWDPDARLQAGVKNRIMVICGVKGELAPVGITFMAYGSVLPVQDDQINAVVSDALGWPPASSTLRELAFPPIEALLAYSYEEVRHQTRNPAWAAAPKTATSPDQTKQAIASWANGETPPGVANVAALLTELCDEVLREDPLDGLAATIADIDPTHPTMALDARSAQLMTAAWIAAVSMTVPELG